MASNSGRSIAESTTSHTESGSSLSVRGVLVWSGLVVLILLCAFISSGIGSFKTPYGAVLRLWLSPFYPDLSSGIDPTVSYIVVHVRLARICLAFLVGCGLAMAGTVYQGVLLNPLADPFTLGISTGAAFGASLAIILGLGGAHVAGVGVLPIAAFGGALAALYLVYLLGAAEGKLHVVTVILAGVIVSTFLSALISLIKSLNEDSVSTIVFWIMGSFSGKSYTHVLLVLPYLLAGMGAIFYFTRELDLLSLGDVQAQQLGVDVPRVRFWLLFSASLVTAAAVAVSGVIGFVGLVVPHLVRMAAGPAHKKLIPAVLLSGGLLVMISDSLARSILPGGEEIPVGVVTAILGGPFFCYLMLRRKKQLRLLSG